MEIGDAVVGDQWRRRGREEDQWRCRGREEDQYSHSEEPAAGVLQGTHARGRHDNLCKYSTVYCTMLTVNGAVYSYSYSAECTQTSAV